MQIYKVTNRVPNHRRYGWIYVGKDMRDRNSYYGSSKLLCKDIKKYGKENFVKEILDQCYDSDHLEFMECFWIQEFPECYNIGYDINGKGYNLTKGGEGCIGRITINPVLQFDKKGNFIKEWKSAQEASNSLDIPYCQINKVCIDKAYTAGKDIWVLKSKFSEKELSKKLKQIKEVKRDKSVKQISLDGIPIKEWNSAMDVYLCLKIPYGHIIEVCEGKRLTAGNYLWIFREYTTEEIDDRIRKYKEYLSNTCKPVCQIDKDTNKIIREWESASEAERVLGIFGTGIQAVCQKKPKKDGKGYYYIPQTAGGFKWEYKNVS